MKLCRVGPKGQEQPAFVDGDGHLRDLSSIVNDITPHWLGDGGVSKLASIDFSDLPLIDPEVRYGVPVAGIPKIVAIGLNYADHAKESGLPIPSEPIMFAKAVTSLTGPNDEVMLPRGSTHTDWEVELGFIIGKTASYVAENEAMSHVAGYVLANDVSERFNQKERGSQWSKGKGHDTFCPLGPWLVTPDEIEDPHALDMHLNVNGERMQSGNTRTMIFNIPQIISYVSEFVTLKPGDLVITGTPPGVGEGMTPKRFLKPGDNMELSISGLGIQKQSVVEWKRISG